MTPNQHSVPRRDLELAYAAAVAQRDRYREHLEGERRARDTYARETSAYLYDVQTTLREIAEFIEERHKEGDTEYQVAVLARTALNPAKSHPPTESE